MHLVCRIMCCCDNEIIIFRVKRTICISDKYWIKSRKWSHFWTHNKFVSVLAFRYKGNRNWWKIYIKMPIKKFHTDFELNRGSKWYPFRDLGANIYSISWNKLNWCFALIQRWCVWNFTFLFQLPAVKQNYVNYGKILR